MSGAERCPKHGDFRDGDELGGLCPHCLLAVGLAPPAPQQIGDYEILEELGRGGMGIIYRAQHRTIASRVVALKVIRAGELATPQERRRFRAEIEAVARLKHPHIVPVYEIGEHAGEPYYTMPVYEAALADRLAHFQRPESAAELVAKVARAVYHGHERGVLHRDLKPANILLDERDEPHVSDFGIAKRVGEQSTTESGALIGSPRYMAPEQLRGDESTITSDVYSLGVVLYELLTGKRPFGDGDLPSLQRAGDETEPASPRALVRTVPRDLETICLKCLKMVPTARYRTAQDLADDLQRFLCGESITARSASLAEKAWRFVWRHRLVGAGMSVSLLLLVVAAVAFYIAHTQELELQHSALRINSYAANAHAGAVAFHLSQLLDTAAKIAADPSILPMIYDVDQDALEQRRVGTPFDTITLMDRTGIMTAQAPIVGPGLIGLDYSWRDYFIGAKRLGEAGIRGGYISRALLSETDQTWKFGITAPIYKNGKWAGVLLLTVGTDSALGGARLDRASDDGPMAVVVAPQDRSRNSTKRAGEYVVILHDDLAHGAGVPIDSPQLSKLHVTRTDRNQLRWVDSEPLTDNDHYDPVQVFEDRWLASFAPVGDTGFVVIVQTRYDAAVAPNTRPWHQAGWIASIAAAGWTAAFGAYLYRRHRRRKRITTPQQRSPVLTGE